MQYFLKIQYHLERWQALIYFASVIFSILMVVINPYSNEFALFSEKFIHFALAFMLFVTFLQIPITSLIYIFRDFRFLTALLFGNFIVIPCFVYGLTSMFTLSFLIKFGILIVLLSPCIDYVVTFTHIGKGDARSLLGAAAFLLLLQMVLLPLYLMFFLGHEAANYINISPLIKSFFWLIIMPLSLAGLVQFWAKKQKLGYYIKNCFDILPVFATATVLFIVVLAIAPQVILVSAPYIICLFIFILYSIFSPIIGICIAYIWNLDKPQMRSISFSMATRNSLVIMPLALTIPGSMPLLPAIIITQTLVELVFQLLYIEISKRL